MSDLAALDGNDFELGDLTVDKLTCINDGTFERNIHMTGTTSQLFTHNISTDLQTVSNTLNFGTAYATNMMNFGYASVTQTTSINTDVTINTQSGTINLFGQIPQNSNAQFIMHNSHILSQTQVVASLGIGGPGLTVSIENGGTPGQVTVYVYNTLTSQSSKVPSINFILLTGG